MKIIFRGDSGFCRHQMLRWCERHNVGYIVGVAKNNRLKGLSEKQISDAAQRLTETGVKQRLFGEIEYAADTWDRRRRVIVKAEHTDKGSNPRYVVTNLQGEPKHLYDNLYCARGDMENRIKEQQLDLFSGRTSCNSWWANQFRLLLSSLAYTLMEAIRRLALKGTELSKAQCCTIRLKLIKIGAVIVRNTRRIRFMLSSAYPYQKLFTKVVACLDTG